MCDKGTRKEFIHDEKNREWHSLFESYAKPLEHFRLLHI